MGGAILTVTGKTEEEVEQKLNQRKREALLLGLYEEIRTPAEYDPEQEQYRALLKLHT